ncbi:unnamed protein product [Musa textilis]
MQPSLYLPQPLQKGPTLPLVALTQGSAIVTRNPARLPLPCSWLPPFACNPCMRARHCRLKHSRESLLPPPTTVTAPLSPQPSREGLPLLLAALERCLLPHLGH